MSNGQTSGNNSSPSLRRGRGVKLSLRDETGVSDFGGRRSGSRGRGKETRRGSQMSTAFRGKDEGDPLLPILMKEKKKRRSRQLKKNIQA